MKGIAGDAAIEALDILRDVAGKMRTEELGDGVVLARYAQHRGNPQRILAFTAQHLGPEAAPQQVMQEAQRYEEEMETLLRKKRGG